jgi:hypothetical protein
VGSQREQAPSGIQRRALSQFKWPWIGLELQDTTNASAQLSDIILKEIRKFGKEDSELEPDLVKGADGFSLQHGKNHSVRSHNFL